MKKKINLVKILLSLFVALILFSCSKTNVEAVTCVEDAPYVDKVTLDDIKNAQNTLSGVAVKTDLVKCDWLSNSDRNVYLKLETMQPVKSFKLRGAYNKVANLTDDEKGKELVTCSAGNHAQGVGFAADKFGYKAKIFVPSTIPEVKLSAIKSYKNAEPILVPTTYDDAHNACDEYVKNNDCVNVAPYDDKYVIAGQGTIGLEIIDDLPDVDAVIAPIGGGGLISGIAVATKKTNSDIKVFGIEPENAASMKKSIENKKIITLDDATTIADGTSVKTPGNLTFDICSHYVDDFYTISEDDIEKAIVSLFKKSTLVVEGAGALPVAAVMNGLISDTYKNVVCIISGANIDRKVLENLLKKHPNIS